MRQGAREKAQTLVASDRSIEAIEDRERPKGLRYVEERKNARDEGDDREATACRRRAARAHPRASVDCGVEREKKRERSQRCSARAV